MEPKRVLLFFAIAAVGAVVPGEECVHMCDSGTKCVTKAMRCDGYPDCEDVADEENCRADGCDGLACADGQCIQNNEHCNGHQDCSDGSDELGCKKSSYLMNHPSLSEEELCMMPCRSGKCVFGKQDIAKCVCEPKWFGQFCHQNSEHASFTEPEVIVREQEDIENEVRHELDNAPRNDDFVCKSTQRPIPWRLVCNGNADCEDRSDESNCTRADYGRTRSDLQDQNLCVMPCRRGMCKFNAKDVAYCKCENHFEGTFCDSRKPSNRVPETADDSTTRPTESPTSTVRSETAAPTDAPPKVPTPAHDATPSTSPAEASSTEPAKSATDEIIPEVESGGSNFFSIVVIPLIVVTTVAILLYLLMVKPCKKQRYDNSV